MAEHVHSISEREEGIPTTAVTNELARAFNVALPRLTEGQIFPKLMGEVLFGVKIISAGTPDGLYKVIIGKPRVDTQFDPTSDGAEFDFFDYDYDLPSGESYNAYFANIAEENKSPHWLDSGGHYYGWLHPCPTTDGYPLIIGHTFDTQECEENPQTLIF